MCIHCYLSSFILQIHYILQFHITLLAVIVNFGKTIYEIYLALVHFSPLAQYRYSFKILRTAAFSIRLITEDISCSLFLCQFLRKTHWYVTAIAEAIKNHFVEQNTHLCVYIHGYTVKCLHVSIQKKTHLAQQKCVMSDICLL